MERTKQNTDNAGFGQEEPQSILIDGEYTVQLWSFIAAESLSRGVGCGRPRLFLWLE